jgi:predicted lysophospholipase L1 biosynthesis ABC-type transport system permease subunit
VTDREGKNFTTLRPGEYVFMAGVMAIFAALVVLMVTREPLTAVLAGAGIFVIVAIAIAMLLLAIIPNATPEGEKKKPETGND